MKKTTQKKILCTLLSLILAISGNFTIASASNTRPDNPPNSEANTERACVNEEEYIKAYILANHGISVSPTSSYKLLDQSGNETFSCVEFSHGDNQTGYAIVDLSSYDIIMYSLAKLPPFNQNDIVVCGGILNIAVMNDDSTATLIGSNKQIDTFDLFDNSRDSVDVLSEADRQELIANLGSPLIHTRSVAPTLDCADDDDDVFNAGWNSGDYETDCGINAAAMYLNYMDKYYDNGYLPPLVTGEKKIKVALSAYTTRTLTSDLLYLTASELATICNGYTKEHGTVATSIASSTYKFSKLSDVIDNGNGKPCILRLPEKATSYWTGSHFVIGLGYTSGASSSSGSIYVNSGWDIYGFVYIPTTAPSHIVK